VAQEGGLMTFLIFMLGVYVAIALWPGRARAGKLYRYDWDQAI